MRVLSIMQQLLQYKFKRSSGQMQLCRKVKNIGGSSESVVIGGDRGISILGEVRNVEISMVAPQLLCSKSHDFLAIFAIANWKINQIAWFLDEIIQEDSD